MSFYTPTQARRLTVLADVIADSLLIHEIYASIQGESTYAGLPCTFVRLTGCHLRCRWCDTPHAFAEGRPMTIDQIVERVLELPPDMIELTGGEPLAQNGALVLMKRLADAGKKILLETSGSLPIDDVDPRVVVICDLKCPSSGEEPANRYENLARLKPTDEVKFVIGDRGDFDWAVQKVREYNLLRLPVLFAPVFGELAYHHLCEWILESRLPIRFGPQLHKHVWDPLARGV